MPVLFDSGTRAPLLRRRTRKANGPIRWQLGFRVAQFHRDWRANDDGKLRCVWECQRDDPRDIASDAGDIAVTPWGACPRPRRGCDVPARCHPACTWQHPNPALPGHPDARKIA